MPGFQRTNTICILNSLGTKQVDLSSHVTSNNVPISRITIVYEDGSNPPNAAETVDLLKASISVDYILNIPRMMTGTPFASTNEAYLSTL